MTGPDTLYSLSTINGQVLWASAEPGPVRPPELGNPILDIVNPLYFSAEDMLREAEITAQDIRSRALELAAQLPKATIAAHPTVLENAVQANEEVSLWHLASDVLAMPELEVLYRGSLLRMAQLRVPGEEVVPMAVDENPYCLFVTEVLPEGSRMDIHRDGRYSVIVNLSQPEHRGRSLLGHPDLLKYGKITLDMLLHDKRTLVQRLFPGCGVAFDVTTIPHVGVSDPGKTGHRVILDADFQMPKGRAVDLSVYNSYE